MPPARSANWARSPPTMARNSRTPWCPTETSARQHGMLCHGHTDRAIFHSARMRPSACHNRRYNRRIRPCGCGRDHGSSSRKRRSGTCVIPPPNRGIDAPDSTWPASSKMLFSDSLSHNLLFSRRPASGGRAPPRFARLSRLRRLVPSGTKPRPVLARRDPRASRHPPKKTMRRGGQAPGRDPRGRARTRERGLRGNLANPCPIRGIHGQHPFTHCGPFYSGHHGTFAFAAAHQYPRSRRPPIPPEQP
jgi:hypothetical protein